MQMISSMAALTLILVLVISLMATASHDGNKKKSVLDYSEADIERLYQQWEENDEEEGPEGEPQPEGGVGIDLEALRKGSVNPEELMRQTKKNKPVMMFVGVAGEASHARTEKISSLWVQSLQNAHLQVDRYIVAPDRVLLVSQDGSKAWDVKDYLVTQTDCTTVSFEQLSFNCAQTSTSKTEL